MGYINKASGKNQGQIREEISAIREYLAEIDNKNEGGIRQLGESLQQLADQDDILIQALGQQLSATKLELEETFLGKLQEIGEKQQTLGGEFQTLKQQQQTLEEKLLRGLGDSIQENNVLIRALSDQMAKSKQELEAMIDQNTGTTVEAVKRTVQVEGSRHNELMHAVEELKPQIDLSSDAKDTAGLVKEAIKSKWALVDKFYSEPKRIICEICHTDFETKDAEMLTSECIFGGGKLVRYRCPNCGAIIGPAKMLEMTEEELGDEYRLHYSVFSEGNTTEMEMRTFFSLEPEKGKKYLNYGAGAWSETIDRLRKEGYDVYGYDPYAPTSSDYIIKDIKELEKRKFDGIFSHDLLEHLRYPIQTFKIFRSLLKEGARMAHASACYEYLYEYTRFHLFFYTGKSVDYICKECGLKVVHRDIDNENLFINYIYERENTQS